MFRIAIASCLASAAMVIVVMFSRPSPRIVVDVPGPGRSSLIRGVYAYHHDSRVPENTVEHWNRYVIYRNEGSSYSSKPPVDYRFLDCETGAMTGPWNPPDVNEKHLLARERFDYKGRILIEEGPAAQYGVVRPKILHRVDPVSLDHESFVLPAEVEVIGFRICADGSRLLRFVGGLDLPLKIEWVDLEDMSLINVVEFPDRLGYVDSWRDQTSMAEYAVSTDGRFIAMTESWQQDSRMTPAGVEIYDLKNGIPVNRFRLTGDDPPVTIRPEIIADTDRNELLDYPLVSEREGHVRPRFAVYQGEVYLSVGHGHRRKYQADNGWQIDTSGHECFHLKTEERIPEDQLRLPVVGATDYKVLHAKSIDGSRQLWQTGDSSGWEKEMILVDQNGGQLGQQVTLPLWDSESEVHEVNGVMFPGQQLVALPVFLSAELPGFESDWRNMLTGLLPATGSEIMRSPVAGKSGSFSRTVLHDFETGHRFEFRNPENLDTGSIIAGPNRVVLLHRKDWRSSVRKSRLAEPAESKVQPRIEIWDVPSRPARFGLAWVVGIVVFCVTATVGTMLAGVLARSFPFGSRRQKTA